MILFNPAKGLRLGKKVCDGNDHAMTREICKACWTPSPVGFTVPNYIWIKAVPREFVNSVLCIQCFTRFADENLVKWDKEIEFHPVSLVTLHRTDKTFMGKGVDQD